MWPTRTRERGPVLRIVLATSSRRERLSSRQCSLPPLPRTSAVSALAGGACDEARWMRPARGVGVMIDVTKWLLLQPDRRIHGRTHGRYEGLASSRFAAARSEEHTSELQSLTNLVCRLLLEKKKKKKKKKKEKKKEEKKRKKKKKKKRR